MKAPSIPQYSGVAAGLAAGLVAKRYGYGLQLFAVMLVLTVVVRLLVERQRGSRWPR